MLKCSKEAFAACPDRKGCGCPEAAVFTEGSECDMFNRQIGSHVMTHGDQIRAMSDEELADFITDKEKGWCTDIGREMYYQYNLEWLKQPVEVSGDGV